jgi:nucleoside-diphosphate-sugar epimerase
MAPKIFLTGVTGYIGGDIFHTLYTAHPDFDYTLLVRNSDRGAAVAAKYPSAKLIYGDLSASDLISSAAAAADIVIHAAHSDDVASANAIAAGLARGHNPQKPGFWIHVSGTGMLMYRDITAKRWGQPPLEDDVYDDLEGVDKILALPDDAMHRDVEKIVQAANSAAVRTVVVAPPLIYGPGRGPVNRRSMQVYDMAKLTLKHGFAPVVGTGRTEWHEVHVHDLNDLFLALVEAALDADRAADPEIFGERAYFFAENGALVWGEIAEMVAREAHRQGFIQEAKTQVTDVDTLANETLVGITFAANSKSKAMRGRKYLGWKPSRRGLREEIPDIVAGEAERMGLTAKYAN